jgi:outer membrane protein OmpA-like peptidoglycan-associated protein
MKRSYLVIPIVLLTVCAVPVGAQFKDPGITVGISGGIFIGQGDDEKSTLKQGGRAFLRYGLVDGLQGEVGGGYGEIAGKSRVYKTSLFPVDFRLLFSPLEMESFNPYVYAGGGILNYKRHYSPLGKRTGIAPYVPVGAGTQFRLNEHLALEVNGGLNYSLIDTLDGSKKKSQKDGVWTALLGITYTFGSGGGDPDKDGLSNSLEKELGTNPNNADTDGDGLSDGLEHKRYKTDPRKADTDGDGLTDGEEVRKYRTDPLKADTDGDGLSDYDEIIKYKTDPVKIDTDGDGLSDYDEIMKYKTDPLNRDTDSDGLTDGDEVLKYKTDPLTVDTDRDGLTDGEEVLRYKTDPLKIDTDLGGMGDGTEVARGLDPLNPNDDLPKKEEVKIGKRIVLEGITFKTGSAELAAESAAKLEDVFQTLRDNPDVEVEISGHTDNRGSRARNIDLSLSRADAVKTYLVNRGVEAHRIRTKGYGPDRPIAPNSTEDGRAKNRRIEFTRTR